MPKIDMEKIKQLRTWADWKQFAKENKKQVWIFVAVFVALVVTAILGVKSIAVILGLILLGGMSTVFITYSGIHLGYDFNLFGAIVGSYLFAPWVGALIALAEYALISRFPMDDIDYPVGVWFAITALFIMPKIGIDSMFWHLFVGTIVGELGNALYWIFQGIPVPSQVTASLMKLGWYSMLFIYALPGIVAFLI